jgi:hypothetical protein
MRHLRLAKPTMAAKTAVQMMLLEQISLSNSNRPATTSCTRVKLFNMQA